MIFSTFQFLLFFVLLYPTLFIVAKPWRSPLLLAASYVFYLWAVPWYITVILAITLIDFVAGIRIEGASSHRRKRAYLAVSIACNLGLLFAFKYAGFVSHALTDVFALGLPVFQVVLPLGISFHTFQAISYTIEVYRGRVPAERSLLHYALYIAFFPQMVAGPIERPQNLLPQLHRGPGLTFDGFREGVRLIMWGVFKKVVVADLLAQAVGTVYAAPRQFSGAILLVATFFFAVQIYCDFSGYSDMAIGLARMMGYRLMINFRRPYLARSVAEFWRRWHISLSTWFRDYLYIPLGGNRVSPARVYANIMIVFVLSGLWHGANRTFVIWGALHGAFVLLGRFTAPARGTIRRQLGVDPESTLSRSWQILVTFALVTVAWVFFRAATVADAFYIVSHLFDWTGAPLAQLYSLGLPRFEIAVAFGVIAAVATADWLMERQPEHFMRMWSSRPLRWAVYNACVFGIIFFGVFGRIEFIYFQF